MQASPLGVAIVGCGNIAGAYARDLRSYDHVRLLGAFDVDTAKAEAFGVEHDLPIYGSLDEAYADPAVDIAANLTIHHAHYEVSKRALEAGKHVYSEKPMAMTFAEANELVGLARSLNLRLGCSPFTYMGEAQQTAWKAIRDGRLGRVRLVYAEVNWGRIESWHPAPAAFYDVGPLFDVGVYPLTMLTAIFGPVRRVWSYGTTLYPERFNMAGEPFSVGAPDFGVAMLEHADGTVTRLTFNFYVGHHSKQKGIEFHGDAGSLHIDSWQAFDAPVSFALFGKEYEPVEPLREPPKGTPWGRGIAEMAEAMQAGRAHRAKGEHAAHVVEILGATTEAMRSGGSIAVEFELRAAGADGLGGAVGTKSDE